ncbi:hypothetical protein J6590_047942 [Homalodisca vitripennis]|nr:hypothetical protein J6590_047942 [Homalodisca vitripennis]
MFSRDSHISSPYQLLELVESVNCRRVSEWAHAGTLTPATTRRGARKCSPSWYSQLAVGGSLSGLMRTHSHQPPRGEGRGNEQSSQLDRFNLHLNARDTSTVAAPQATGLLQPTDV